MQSILVVHMSILQAWTQVRHGSFLTNSFNKAHAFNRCPRLSSSSIILNWLTKSFITAKCPIGDDEFFEVKDALIDLQNALGFGFCVLDFLSILSGFLSREKLTQNCREPKAEQFETLQFLNNKIDPNQ